MRDLSCPILENYWAAFVLISAPPGSRCLYRRNKRYHSWTENIKSITEWTGIVTQWMYFLTSSELEIYQIISNRVPIGDFSANISVLKSHFHRLLLKREEGDNWWYLLTNVQSIWWINQKRDGSCTHNLHCTEGDWRHTANAYIYHT
jgi:hypothetical protein